MSLTLLGTMGWMPSDRRETTCMACRDGAVLFLFDAGTGLRRLLDPAASALLDGALEVHLFLTHYHLDHVCGLAYLSGVLPGRHVTIHAPEAAITGVDPETAVAGLLRHPYSPQDLHQLTGISVKAVTGRGDTVAGHTIRVRRQRHSDTSVAYRFDDEFVLATDTMADEGTAEFSAGTSLLLHEAWYGAQDLDAGGAAGRLPRSYASHSEAGAVARIAAAARVKRLVLVHLNPLRDERYYAALAEIARAEFAQTEIRDDGSVVDTGAAV
jgi:ribonuclease BN (tRNA processing enzyme)